VEPGIASIARKGAGSSQNDSWTRLRSTAEGEKGTANGHAHCKGWTERLNKPRTCHQNDGTTRDHGDCCGFRRRYSEFSHLEMQNSVNEVATTQGANRGGNWRSTKHDFQRRPELLVKQHSIIFACLIAGAKHGRYGRQTRREGDNANRYGVSRT
jgi:hypothetical protein